MTDTSFLHTDVTLRDGRVVHVRTMLPKDEEELLQAFARMDQHARYMRFMRSIRELNVERLRAALHSALHPVSCYEEQTDDTPT